MSTNDFLPFGTGAGANVISQPDYASLVARLTGFASGVARSNEVNKAIRQSAFVAAMIGQFTADYGGDALDNGDLETFEDNFKAALAAWIASGESPVDLSAYVLRAGDTMGGLFSAPAGFKTAAQLLSSATSLTTAAFGKFVEITAGSSITTTLPTPVSNGGARITVWNNTSYSQTISTPAGAFLGPNLSGGTSTSILPGDLHTFESDGSNWIRTLFTGGTLASLPKLTMFTTSGTWTRTQGARKALVICQGPGGAGSGAAPYTGGTDRNTGEGGGAGAVAISLLDVTALSSAVVVIPAGGVGAVAADGGNGGGTTSFGSTLVSAGPGAGGLRNDHTGSGSARGGSTGTGQIVIPGNSGGTSGFSAGHGAPGLFGGGGRVGNHSTGHPTGEAGAFGGGGGGGDASTESGSVAGGNGGDGFCLVLEL